MSTTGDLTPENTIQGGSDSTLIGNVGDALKVHLTGITVDHNELTAIQGGGATERYHLTAAETTVVANTSGTNTGDETVTTIKSKLGISTLSGSNTGDQTISDATITTTDITTNNATTLKHGFLPKLGGGTTNFLRADGSWSAPPSGSGGGNVTASGQANAEFVWEFGLVYWATSAFGEVINDTTNYGQVFFFGQVSTPFNGDPITIILAGNYTNANFSAPIGTKYYWNGAPTTTRPSGRYVYSIGKVVSTNTIEVNVQREMSALYQSPDVGWNDLVSDVYVKGSGASDPSLATYRNGLQLYAFSASTMNQGWANFHIRHDYAMGTTMYPHVHLTPNTTSTGIVRIGFEYTVAKGHNQASGSVFNATTTVYVEYNISTNSQYKHLIAEVSDGNAIPSTYLEIDSIIICRIFRDASHANDTFPDAIFFTNADIHYKADRFSSLNKAPNFYA